MKPLHKTQSREDLEKRFDVLAHQLSCHPDVMYGRVSDIQNLLREALEFLYISPADYSNGVVAHGLDEGDVLAGRCIVDLLNKGEKLGVKVRHHNAPH